MSTHWTDNSKIAILLFKVRFYLSFIHYHPTFPPFIHLLFWIKQGNKISKYKIFCKYSENNCSLTPMQTTFDRIFNIFMFCENFIFLPLIIKHLAWYRTPQVCPGGSWCLVLGRRGSRARTGTRVSARSPRPSAARGLGSRSGWWRFDPWRRVWRSAALGCYMLHVITEQGVHHNVVM